MRKHGGCDASGSRHAGAARLVATGKLTGGAITGGLIAADTSAPLGPIASVPPLNAFLSGTGTTTNSFWDTQTTGASNAADPRASIDPAILAVVAA